MSDAEAAVRAYLAAERFPASEEEVAALIELYPGLRSMLDGLDELAGAQDADPVVVFDASSRPRAADDS
ncbi:MAG TPA: hypothetical protein VFW09_21125 [Solirubrobacteraceae bacterium]|nr:hypothetical protein [Solirubrobacteraceae bacterium]